MPQATMFAEWCDPCWRSKWSWLLRARLELRFTSLAQYIALAPRPARRERGVAHTNETICVISSAGHVFKRVLRRSRRNPWKGSSRVPLSDLWPYMAHGSIKRWEGKQKCFYFPLREYNPNIPLYPYTWAQPVSLGIPCWSPWWLGDVRVEFYAHNYEFAWNQETKNKRYNSTKISNGNFN